MSGTREGKSGFHLDGWHTRCCDGVVRKLFCWAASSFGVMCGGMCDEKLGEMAPGSNL
jgi:hypothetical protein